MKQRTEFIRVEKTRDFSVIHNGFLRRNDLSWKAKGILTYILTLPNDWNINLVEIMRHATEGEAAFRSGWKELRVAGYVERRPIYDDKTGKITHWETVVRENVDMTTSEPLSDFLHVENLDVDNRKLLNTNNTKYLDIQSTDNNSQQSVNRYADNSEYMKLSKLLFDLIKQRNPKHKKPNFQRWADDIRKLSELDKQSTKDIEKVIRWCQQDSFWKNNILSPVKLRKQFDQLTLKMNSNRNTTVYQNSNDNNTQDEVTPEMIQAFEELRKEREEYG